MPEGDDRTGRRCDDDWNELACAASMLDRKWHPVIVDRLLDRGPMRFDRLEASIDGVSATVLTESLGALEASGVVDRTVVSEKPFRVEYALTERGSDLEPVVAALREWGAEHAATAAD